MMNKNAPECSRRSVLAAGLAAAGWWAAHPARLVAQNAEPAELTQLDLMQASHLLETGEVSPVELTRACLERIERHDPLLNAFITVRAEQALAEARAAEAAIRRGQRLGPLHGIPVALKDNIDTAGIRTTGASRAFADRVPELDAEVARRLKAAGAVLLGKTNLHEFAYGGTSTVTHFGTIRNPWAPDRVTGGSSGGSAAAVAADLCFAALGTDTAGSVRIPAAHCGVVGLKPTYGRVAMRGVLTLSWTLDHVGPLCKTVADAALMMNVIAGYDESDPTTVDRPVPDHTRAIGAATASLRLGVARRPFFERLDSEVEAAVEEALDVLGALTSGVREVEVPIPPVSGPALWGPEAHAYHRPWLAESAERYQPSTRASLERYEGAPALDYVLARRTVDLARRDVARVFAEIDVLVTPVMRVPAPLLADGGGSGPTADAAVFNVLGVPAISVPCGFTAGGLPIGLQLAAAPFAETTVLALAHAYQQSTDWHRRRPGGVEGLD